MQCCENSIAASPRWRNIDGGPTSTCCKGEGRGVNCYLVIIKLTAMCFGSRQSAPAQVPLLPKMLAD